MIIITQQFENTTYTYFKNNSAHTLLFLHGFTGNSSIWNDYVEALKNRYDIILIDLVGHGNSISPKTLGEYLFENQTATIERLLNNLGVRSLSVIAYSFSCYMGFLLEERMKGKIKSLIFISPYFKKEYHFLEKLGSKFIAFIWQYLIPDKKFKLDYSLLEDYENPTFNDIKYQLKSTNTKDILGSIYAMINYRRIPDLKIPLLIVYGKDDKKISAETINYFKKFRIVKIKTIENKKHLFLKTKSREVKELIKSFIDSK